jgi:host factor-I protein
MDGEARNLQNEFFNAARKAKKLVTVYLNSGKKLTGRIKSFDKFSLLLDGHQGELVVYKHAVSTVGLAGRPHNDSSEDERRPAPGGTPPGNGGR